ncbi:uncharacterized protein PFL1_04543 [Pseudozyma flocculosa PF-1]|uniref:Uncharacterized protein n=2 Tax=Pseudozyma flocculosa TaxID=84751 RepID=A0A5C3F9E6_9BASI|nr:uncharacterized protein PFL1_04543 [Pseudozyma flocculosa PF-1]EPQ27798.1 hypothetical protein PFL1_04543 [Pseudozyma flocculosa PF-1]SPO41074.1 uncharacterized protein PSFLO_06556 [Pseudozyma flocculosa]
MLSATPIHPARAALRSKLRPPGSAASHRHISHRSNIAAGLTRRTATSCASPQSYHVLSKAAARVYARSASNGARAQAAKLGGNGLGSWRSFFARFAASLRSASIPRGGARYTALYTSLIRQSLQRAVLPRLGSLRLAIDAGVARQLAKNVSPIFRGAVQAFTGLQVRAGQISGAGAAQSVSHRLNLSRQPVISFARGSVRPGTGFGPRAPLVPRSPTYGAGLQTARNFSSGGRVFDNLIVNAPLAVRLAGNELDEKRKMAKASPARGPRRTAAAITHKQREAQAMDLGRRLAAQVASGGAAAAAAPCKSLKKGKGKQSDQPAQSDAVVIPHSTEATASAVVLPSIEDELPSVPASYASSVMTDEADYSEQMLSYFEIPPWEAHTRLTIRRAEPIATMLGGRPPQPARPGRALFDDRFVEDAQLGIEFEERRWLKIQAILRALYEHDPHRHLSITEDGDLYIVLVRGLRADDAEQLIRRRVGFELDFVDFEELAMPDGLDLSTSLVGGDRAGSMLIDRDGREAPASSDVHGDADLSLLDGGSIALPPSGSADESPVSLTMTLPSSSSAASSSSLLLSDTWGEGGTSADDEAGFLYDSREFVQH